MFDKKNNSYYCSSRSDSKDTCTTIPFNTSLNDVIDLRDLMVREYVDRRNLSIKIKYHNDKLTKIKAIDKGNFVDLRSAEKVELKAGEFKLINLGVSIKLPDGYWGQLVPRSSLFKNHGLIQTNSFGVIDTSYCGEDDVWMMPVYATRDTVIEFDERICQFRLVKDNSFVIEEVDHLDDVSRGGFGSTGNK